MELILEWIIRFVVWLSRWTSLLSRFGMIQYEQWQQGKKLRILLVGYNGARNTGADARVVALVGQLLQEFGQDQIEITVMTLSKENTRGYFPSCVNIYPFSTFFCWSLLRAASSHHMAILCEGSTLTHTFADALSMFFCQAAGIMRRQGKPCVAYGSDVTPLNHRLRRLTLRMCSEVHFIARSEPSLRALEEMGLKCTPGTDTAWTFHLPDGYDKGRKMLLEQGWDGGKKLIGVAVIDPYCWPVRPSFLRWAKAFLTGKRELQYDKMYFFSDSESRRRNRERYLNELSLAIRTYREQHEAFVVVIGMEKLDQDACEKFRQLLGGDSALITSSITPVFEMTSVLHCLDILVTSRYHAAVLSMLKGMPIVAVSMDGRLDGLFNDIPAIRKHLHHVNNKDLSQRIIRSLEEASEHEKEFIEATNAYARKCRMTLQKMSMLLRERITESQEQQPLPKK